MTRRDIRQQNAERRLSHSQWETHGIHPAAWAIGLGLLILAIVVTR